MKLVIIMLFLPILSFSQEKSISTTEKRLELCCDFVYGSYELQKENFAKALAYEKKDSFKNAIIRHIYVVGFDSLTIEGRLSKAKLDSIYNITKANILHQFKGEWDWIWSGSDYSNSFGKFPSTCHCKKKMTVSDKQVIIIEDGKEKQRFFYEIEHTYYSIIHKTLTIKEVKTDSIRWRIRPFLESDKYFDYPFSSMEERSEGSSLFLEVNYTPHFVCGISYGKFEKQNP